MTEQTLQIQREGLKEQELLKAKDSKKCESSMYNNNSLFHNEDCAPPKTNLKKNAEGKAVFVNSILNTKK